ncbi:hypothetical protein KSP40_PGU009561 [Platanthera guangdongensis]|uniref:YqaJ viral recombinase domain-containing protein n=1 Tax=Platanthera guangdongensis TaxID=2320717 RepID=A0ABR2LN62_9ASPA
MAVPRRSDQKNGSCSGGTSEPPATSAPPWASGRATADPRYGIRRCSPRDPIRSKKPPQHPASMNWGTANEAAAIERYRSMTGNDVSFQRFAVSAETGSGWLGASPDGLVGCHPDAGILEVKCPYNKGRPELGSPWKTASYCYMSQVLGQMEIMDRDWVDLYCWMPNGSALFHVFRDREYWGLMHGMLRDFWRGSVVPARQAVAAEDDATTMSYEPEARHELTGKMIRRSLNLAEKAAMTWRTGLG